MVTVPRAFALYYDENTWSICYTFFQSNMSTTQGYYGESRQRSYSSYVRGLVQVPLLP